MRKRPHFDVPGLKSLLRLLVAVGVYAGNKETRIPSWSSGRTVRPWEAATGQQIGPAMIQGLVRVRNVTRMPA
jgi:hypothetical protein